MRILACTTSWPHPGDPAAGRFVRDLHEDLVREGHSVTTIVPSHHVDEQAQFGVWGSAVPTGDPSADSMRLVSLGGMEANSREMGLLRARAALVALRTSMVRSIQSHLVDADIILAHWAWPVGAWAALATKHHRVPIVAVSHGGDVRVLRRPLWGAWPRHQLRNALAGLICTNSEGARVIGRAASLADERILRTPMGYNEDVFDREESPDIRHRVEDAPVVGAGRLVAIKGFDLLVRAMAGMGRRLVIAGDGPLRQKLAEDAAACGVDLSLPGQMAPHELAKLFRSAAVVVIPSRSLRGGTEGFPIVALEAVACGVPVVASMTGGLPDLFPSTHLVAANDVAGLRSAIVQQLATPTIPHLSPSLASFTRAAVAARVSNFLTKLHVAGSQRHT